MANVDSKTGSLFITNAHPELNGTDPQIPAATAQKDKSTTREKKMQKWEYLEIESRGDTIPGLGYPSTSIHYIYNNRRKVPDSDKMDFVNYIAGLGDQGWELVGCGNTSQYNHALYFKRPKP